MLRPQAADQLPHRTLIGLLGVIAAVLAPHLWRGPLWLTAAVIGVLVVRGAISRRGWQLPPKLVTIAAALLGSAAIAAHYGTILGPDAGVSLLVLMSVLKLLETRSRRDTIITVFLAYFLVLTHFLFDESLLTAGYMLVAGWATTSILIAISHRQHARLGLAEVRLGGTLVLQGLPVMVLLFLLFPRLPGPLWGMPEDANSGVTGMSDSMSPGSISELSQSDEVAFRVRFDDTVPPPRERYWRGLVLADYNGDDWTRAEVSGSPRPAEYHGDPIEYTVTLEPHNQRWLFALDLPARKPERGSLSFFHERRSKDAVRETIRYEGRSYTDYRLEPELTDRARSVYTWLPDDRHDRAKELARTWADDASTDEAIVDRAMDYFRDEPFEYTLSPAPLPDDHVDGFLFETRSGFCENYAGAMTVLMRAAGLPARVVIGYQGATESANGDYYNVRQSDAHAWTEVWLPDEGWRRVDPTAAVSPERVESGLGASMPESDDVPTMARGSSGGLLRSIGRTWDVIDATWTSWVLTYSSNSQESLLESLGLDDALRLAGALAAGLLGFAGIMGLVLVWQQTGPRHRDPAHRLWRRAERQLARQGVPPRRGEGPLDYAERVAREAPYLADAVREAARQYVRLRYYPQPEHGGLARLRVAVKRLRRRRVRSTS